MPRTSLVALGALSLLAAAGCKQPTQTRYLSDTAFPQPDTGPDDACAVGVIETRPVQGAVGVYYRDEIRVIFDDPGRASTIQLASADGAFEPVQILWDDAELNATVEPLSPLDASTDYVLTVQTCPENDAVEVAFTTSSFGAPMTVEPASLEEQSYHLALGDATYHEPGGLGPIIANYLDQPLLIGVVDANVDSMTLLGAQGRVDGTSGAILQHGSRDTWYFGAADFRARPFFSAYASAVPLTYEDTEITFYNFTLEGTFSADGTAIGGCEVVGQIDTRNLGPLLQLGSDPSAACDYVAGVGLECIACPDGQDLCLDLRATFPTARLVDDLTLVPR